MSVIVVFLRPLGLRLANPDMVKVVKKYTDHDLDAVVEYMASITMPGSMCAAKPAKKK